MRTTLRVVSYRLIKSNKLNKKEVNYKMEYRTDKQFEGIKQSIYNGNWTQGAKEVVLYGFYANDLLKALREYNDMFGFDDEDKGMDDMVLLIEMATELRLKD